MTNEEWNESRKQTAEKIKNFFLAAPPDAQLALALDLLRYYEEYGSELEELNQPELTEKYRSLFR